jgi:adenylate cyclase
MKIEIERKFLLASERWRSLVDRSDNIQDGLLSTSEAFKIRVRLIGERSTLTLKTQRVGPQREEFEYDIPRQDAERLLSLCGSDVIRKVRHYVGQDDLTWEIDEYEGLLEGVILAEVELAAFDQPIDLPDWIGAEVTAEPPYSKFNMLRERQENAAQEGEFHSPEQEV